MENAVRSSLKKSMHGSCMQIRCSIQIYILVHAYYHTKVQIKTLRCNDINDFRNQKPVKF